MIKIHTDYRERVLGQRSLLSSGHVTFDQKHCLGIK